MRRASHIRSWESSSTARCAHTVDHRNDERLQLEVPTLAEMTEVALESLSQSREGFLLQVEGARIDHAAHNNDAAALLWDQLAGLDDAILTVLRFAEKNLIF